ncbi:MAG TPA: hypothetical protein VIH75_11580 [Candidatus Sulfotelmatobacter sp.]
MAEPKLSVYTAEQRRGHDSESLSATINCNGPNVGIDAEDLLEKDEPTPWLGAAFRDVSAELVVIRSR